MRIVLWLFVALAASGSLLHGQSGPQLPDECKLQAVSPTPKAPKAKPGATLEGFKRSPIVAFEIDEAGTVQHARTKRSSGSATADEIALGWVRRWKCKPRPGCGMIESSALVTIDFTAP
jgi:TonB family protein